MLLIALAIVGGFALRQHNADGRARQMDAITAKALVDEAAHREAIRTAPRRLADLAACSRSLPRAACERLFDALDCYEGRYECPGACDTHGNGLDRWPDYKGS